MKIRTAKRLHDALTSCNKLALIAAADAPVPPNGNNTEMLAAERLLEIIGEALKVATRTDPSQPSVYFRKKFIFCRRIFLRIGINGIIDYFHAEVWSELLLEPAAVLISGINQ